MSPDHPHDSSPRKDTPAGNDADKSGYAERTARDGDDDLLLRDEVLDAHLAVVAGEDLRAAVVAEAAPLGGAGPTGRQVVLLGRRLGLVGALWTEPSCRV